MADGTVRIEFTTNASSVKEQIEAVGKSAGNLPKVTPQNPTPGLAVTKEQAQQAYATIGLLGGTLTSSLTTPLVNAGKASINTAATFDDSMAQVAGSLGISSDKLGNLRQLALDLGSSTVFSASEAAQAMVELAKGGMTEAQIQGGALAASMDLAAAGGMNLADASNVTVQMMGAFGLSAEDAASISDALAGAANASSADVSDLSQAMSQCSAQASLAGWSLQDTSATLALFADNGIRGSDAGTSLKTMLQRLQAPTDEAAKAMKQIGIETRNSDGSMKSVSEIAQELHDKMGNLTEAQRDQAMQTIFGSDASRAAAVLMKSGADGLAKYQQATQDATAAETMAAAQKGSLSWAIENMNGAIETASIKLGEVLAPIVEKVAEFVGNAAEAFGNLPGPVQIAIVAIGALLAAIGPLLIMIGTIGMAIPMVTAGFAAFGTIFAAITAPAIAIVAAIAAVVAILIYLWNTSEGFRDAVTSALTTITEAVNSAIAYLLPYLQAFFDQLMSLINTALSIILPIIENFLIYIVPVITAAVSSIVETVAALLGTILNTITGIMQSIQLIIVGAWDIIAGLIQTVVGLIVGIVTGDFSMMQSGISTILGGIKTFIFGAFNLYSSIISGILNGIVQTVTGALNLVSGIFSGTFNGIKNVVSNIMGSAGNTVKNSLDAIAGFFKGLHLEFPRIKLPHFSISGDFSIVPPRVPSLSIQWYKTGAIFAGPSLIGVGEAGAEAVLPIQNKRYMAPFADAIAERINPSGQFEKASSPIIYNIGDITVNMEQLKDLATLEDVVNLFIKAKQVYPTRTA